MKFDFGKLGSASGGQRPTDPIRLFETLPSLPNTLNDLWRGQAEALTEWHQNRQLSDVLISLNTGAGKTVLGLLIAQSLVNEGLEHVVYVCSTNDLVKQTAIEANRIGIPYTTRSKAKFSNDLFETDQAFCITTYSALFNGRSTIRSKFFPEAIIFDDAHVAENILRDAFTIRIDSAKYGDLFKEVANLFADHFSELGNRGQFNDAIGKQHYATAFAAPRAVHSKKAQILEIFDRHRLQEDESIKYAYSHLRDHIECCAAIFTHGAFELAPPFLPTLAMDVFDRPVRRIYLSATLSSQIEFVRAFGRVPKKVVMPSNDAGNGERLVLFEKGVQNGFPTKLAKEISLSNKIVIAVPNYQAAGNWSDVASPPAVEQFSDELDKFRKEKVGAFVLVARVDGIDLPHDTCRIMLMEGVPSGTSLIEKFQYEFLRMANVQSYRIANRIAQLFGRINRGRNDYGAFLVKGHELNVWLSRDRNLSILPPLLQRQIILGREVQTGLGINDHNAVKGIVSAVLGRDQDWLDYYSREIKLAEIDKEQADRVSAAEPVLLKAAISEANYACAIWNRNYALARRTLEATVDEATQADTPLGGWHNIWVAAAYDLEGDRGSAENHYAKARYKIGPAITLPQRRWQASDGSVEIVFNSFGNSIRQQVAYTSGGAFETELRKIREELELISSGSPRQAEAGLRKLGELLGFRSERPDNDVGTGPDVTWVDDDEKKILGFELKTDKSDPATYFKKDVAQGHDHIEWMASNYSECEQLGLLFVGPDGLADSKANPSEGMGLCLIKQIESLRGRLVGFIDAMRDIPPIERLAAVDTETKKQIWSLSSLASELWSKNLSG